MNNAQANAIAIVTLAEAIANDATVQPHQRCHALRVLAAEIMTLACNAAPPDTEPAGKNTMPTTDLNPPNPRRKM